MLSSTLLSPSSRFSPLANLSRPCLLSMVDCSSTTISPIISCAHISRPLLCLPQPLIADSFARPISSSPHSLSAPRRLSSTRSTTETPEHLSRSYPRIGRSSV